MAMKKYNDLKIYGSLVPLYLDLIIIITVRMNLLTILQLKRAYANIQVRKVLTAEKIMEQTRRLLEFYDSLDLRDVEKMRGDLPTVPMFLLQ